MQPNRLNDFYVSRMPTAPRIHVPPPSFAPTPTLPATDTLNRPVEESSSWTYADRRLSQPILPYLYLGPTGVGKDTDYLTKQGITMVIAMRFAKPSEATTKPIPAGIRAAASIGIKTEVIDVYDNQKLIAALPAGIKAMNDHINEQKAINGHAGKILVACESGNEKSAVLVIAYLMECLNMSLITAIHQVQIHRFCINLDDDLKQILSAFEGLSRARKETRDYTGSETSGRRQSKRALEDEDDDDGDMMDMDDGLQPNRTFQPFQDDAHS